MTDQTFKVRPAGHNKWEEVIKLSRTEQIISLEAEADKLEGEAGKLKWKPAELIVEELAEGTSRQALADSIGKSPAHVTSMAIAWQSYSPDRNRDKNFNDYYQLVSRERSSFTWAAVRE